MQQRSVKLKLQIGKWEVKSECERKREEMKNEFMLSRELVHILNLVASAEAIQYESWRILLRLNEILILHKCA